MMMDLNNYVHFSILFVYVLLYRSTLLFIMQSIQFINIRIIIKLLLVNLLLYIYYAWSVLNVKFLEIIILEFRLALWNVQELVYIIHITDVHI